MSGRQVHYLELVIIGAALIIGGGAFFLLLTTDIEPAIYVPRPKSIVYPAPTSTSTPPRPILNIDLPAIQPRITERTASVSSSSPTIFAYAHGTVAADGKLFIGLANISGNTFSTNQITIFGNPDDLAHPTTLALPYAGDIETMVYDHKNDKIYFMFSDLNALVVYILDPHTYTVRTLVATTSINGGKKPAIVTDGTYIYGITNTSPSTVFRIKIFTGEILSNAVGHIANGHSATLGLNGTTTELFFGGGMNNGFEKVDASTLDSVAKVDLSPCNLTDDMPFAQTDPSGGYIYVGCEIVPYGVRINSRDLHYDRFSLPGASLGLFVLGSDLYNTARDGHLDIFRASDLTHIERLKVTDDSDLIDASGTVLELNELLYSAESDRLFFTAWNGVRGLYEIATST